MKVSIITACFNSAGTIADTLESVNRQDHPDLEQIVIDGGSSDSTLELVRKTGKRVRTLVSEPDGGIYHALNKGLVLATGDLVGFLHSDDVFASHDSVSHIVQHIGATGAEACYGDLVYVRQDDLRRIVRYWRSRAYRPNLCTSGWMPPHPTFYVRKSVYDRCGPFDTTFRISSDFEMCLRLLDVQRISASYLPETLVRMRVGGLSNASLANIVRANFESMSACRKHGLDSGLGFLARKLGSKLPQLWRRPGPTP